MSSLTYTAGIAESFLDHYATGLYSITELCKLVNISTNAYYYWKKNIPEFQEALKEAEKRKIHNIHTLAIKGAVRLITGEEYDEVSEEYEVPPPKPKYDFLDDDDPLNQVIKPEEPKPVLKKRYVTKKRVLPNANAVMFALRNLDKENFPDNKELKFDNTQPIPVAFVPPAGVVPNFPSNTEADASDSKGSTESSSTSEPGNDPNPTQ
jgi:hypothetical protein